MMISLDRSLLCILVALTHNPVHVFRAFADSSVNGDSLINGRACVPPRILAVCLALSWPQA